MTSLPAILQQWFCLIASLLIGGFFLVEFAPAIGRLCFGLRSQSMSDDDKDDDDAEAGEELCRKCGYDARGFPRCPECGVITTAGRRQKLACLRTDRPTETIAARPPDPGESPVLILETTTRVALDLLQQHLQARGVVAQVNVTTIPGLAAYSNASAHYKLTVWSQDVERATAIVDHLWPEEMRE